MRRIGVALLLVTMAVAGCLDDGADPGPEEPQPEPAPVVVADGRVEMTIEVPVLLIGFPDETATALDEALPDAVIDHNVYNNARFFVTDIGRPSATTQPNWMLPTADYNVTSLPGVHADLLAALPGMMVGDQINASAVEDWLAETLPGHGVELAPSHPALVYLHLGSLGDHSYRVQYSSGHIDNARVFGERQPLLATDISAQPDPWVGTRQAWNSPLGNGTDVVPELVAAIEKQTHLRILQGPLYPPTLRECHGVTLIVASRGTSLTEALPGYSPAAGLLDVPRLTGYWERLLGEGNVHIDATPLQLPQDDPQLDAVLRSSNLDALRFHFDENWDQYWVPHDGCEAYISLFLVGDASDSGISGIAMFDIRNGRRLSLSNFNDIDRATGDEGELSPVFQSGDDSVYQFDWVNFLFSHETGHLFGQRHPHDISAPDGPSGEFTWSSIHSAMSYQVGSKNPEFGTIDYNNHWRNKAASAIIIAQEQGLEGTAEFDAAIWHMGFEHWQAAAEALLPVVDPAGLGGDASQAGWQT